MININRRPLVLAGTELRGVDSIRVVFQPATGTVITAFSESAPIPQLAPNQIIIYMITIRIISFIQKFSDRLNKPLIEGVLDYVNNGEAKLALEILCDHLSEYEINISSGEYDESTELALQLGFEMKNPPFKYLEQLKNNGVTDLT